MQFPPTLVINLADRPEKWKQTQESFAQFPVTLERLDAVRASPGWKGCTASHFKAINLAKERKYEWVLILEDDAQLAANGYAQFMELLPVLHVRRDEWDIFLGGATMVEHVQQKCTTPPLYQAGAYTTHFCLIHRDAYDKILNTYKDGPIDVYYKETMRLWMTNPHIAIQRPGVSDIEHKNTNYNKLFDDASRKLMFMGFLQTYKYLLFILLFTLLFITAFTYFKIPALQTIRRYVSGIMGRLRSQFRL
jgi:GR25 family glycosyltransferase involved in LPS biosynthesis